MINIFSRIFDFFENNLIQIDKVIHQFQYISMHF
jgi:hypothetical protein